MTTSVEWFVLDQVTRITSSGMITTEELIDVDNMMVDCLQDKRDDVALIHTLIDMLLVDNFDFTVLELQRLITFVGRPESGWTRGRRQSLPK